MKVDSSYIYIDSGILATINLIEMFDVKVSRERIRSLFRQACDGRGATIKEIRDVMLEVGIKPLLYKVEKLSDLCSQKNPFITWRNIDADYTEFLCVLKVSEDEVAYINEYAVLAKEPLAAFEASWPNIILLANPQTGIEDPDEVDGEENKRSTFSKEIQVIDNFIDDQLCDRIVAYCIEHGLFNRSKVSLSDEVSSSYGGEVSAYRTSDTAKIIDFSELEGLEDLYTKIAAHLQVPLEYMERFQCVRYTPRTFFSPHFDTGPEFKNPRRYTIIIYLNDDFTEGETCFPELRLKIRPVKGRAVIFDNLGTGQEDINPLSLHAGLPVKEGNKYICTIWTRKEKL